MARRRRNAAQGGLRNKLHPIFFELADLNQQFEKRWTQLQNECKQGLEAVGPAASPELQNEIVARFKIKVSDLDKWMEEKLANIDKRYKPFLSNSLAYSYLTLDPPVSDAEGIFEYLHYQRHGESIQTTAMKDAQGDIEAWDKLARTGRDFRLAAFGKGPIKSFQGDVVHRQLLELVICYESERLTAEELAECADRYCACGKENHEADTLRKMRDRLETELKACNLAQQPATREKQGI